MSAGLYNTDLEIGATWIRVLTWRDSAGALVPLAGYTAKMQLRQQFGSAVILELSTTNGRIVLGGAAGTITLTLDAATTAALLPQYLYYDLDLISGTGVVTRLVQGQISISPAVTVLP